MAYKIITVSLTPDQKDYLDKSQLSPTELLKAKIEEVRFIMDKEKLKIDELEAKNLRMLKTINLYVRFIEETGSWEKYVEFSKHVLEKKDDKDDK